MSATQVEAVRVAAAEVAAARTAADDAQARLVDALAEAKSAGASDQSLANLAGVRRQTVRDWLARR